MADNEPSPKLTNNPSGPLIPADKVTVTPLIILLKVQKVGGGGGGIKGLGEKTLYLNLVVKLINYKNIENIFKAIKYLYWILLKRDSRS